MIDFSGYSFEFLSTINATVVDHLSSAPTKPDITPSAPVKPGYVPLTLDGLKSFLAQREEWLAKKQRPEHAFLNATRDGLAHVVAVEVKGQSKQETAALRKYLVSTASAFFVEYYLRKGNVCSAEDGRLTAEAWLAWSEDWLGKPENNRPRLGEAPGLYLPVRAEPVVSVKVRSAPPPAPKPVQQITPPQKRVAPPRQRSNDPKLPPSPIRTAQEVRSAVGFLGGNLEEWKPVARRITTTEAERELARKLYEEFDLSSDRFEAFMVATTGSSKEKRLAKYQPLPAPIPEPKKPVFLGSGVVKSAAAPPASPPDAIKEEPLTPPAVRLVLDEAATLDLLSRPKETWTSEERAAVEAFEASTAPMPDPDLGAPLHELYSGRAPQVASC